MSAIDLSTNPQPGEESETFSFPSDLTEWVDGRRLFDWLEEEVEKFDWQNPELVEYLRRNPGYRPKMMLCLLAFAYATQVSASEEIVRRCYSDATFRLICRNEAPSAREINAFRRENRGLLKGLLLGLFIRAVREKFEFGSALFPPGLKRYLLDQAVERLDLARHTESHDV